MASTAQGNNCPVGGPIPLHRPRPVLVPALTITKVANTTAVVPAARSPTRSRSPTPGRPRTRGPASPTPWPASWTTRPTTTRPPPPARSATPADPHLDRKPGGRGHRDHHLHGHRQQPRPGDKTMINAVTSTEVGSTCPPASGNTACTASVAVLTPGLTIAKTADRRRDHARRDRQLHVIATNTGQVPFAAANFSDALAGVLDDAPTTPTPSPRPARSPSPAASPGPGPQPRRGGHRHLLRDGRQSGTGDHSLTKAVSSTTSGSHLSCRRHRPPLHQRGPGLQDHDRGLGERDHDQPDRGGADSPTRRQHRADAVHRVVWTASRRRPRRRHLHRRHGGLGRHLDLDPPSGRSGGRDLRGRCDRHRHRLGDGAQPGPREPDPERRLHLGHPRQQLPRRQHRPGLHHDRTVSPPP